MFGNGGQERDQAFAAFMAGSTASLMRTAWLLTGDGAAAEELVQSALVKAYAGWPRIEPGTALAYTRRILVNLRNDSWRSSRRETAAAVLPERASASGSPGWTTATR